MKILQARPFEKAYKRLHANQQNDVNAAIREVMSKPLAGEMKLQDLAGFRVYKFRMNNQLTLLAYQYNEAEDTLILEAVGSHENFYRDLKKSLK